MTETEHRTIYWLMGETGQKGAGLTRIDNLEWLSGFEIEQLRKMRFEKRRNEWLHGRKSVKSLLTLGLDGYRGVSFSRITIANLMDGSPYVLLDGVVQPLSISLSHRQGMAVAAACLDGEIHPGIDLEWIEERDASFYTDYLTPGENVILDAFAVAERAKWGTLIWSAKESMLKALGQGLRVDTRTVQVLRIGNTQDDGWQRMDLQSTGNTGNVWHGYWRQHGNHILTLAVMAARAPFQIQQIHQVDEFVG